VVLVGGLAVLLWPGRSGSTVTATVATNINAVQSTSMKIRLASVPVDDQDKALQFYTQMLGFMKKQDFPMGASRWLTVVSPTEPDGLELLLEPMGFAPARAYQAALFRAGIPATAFQTDDVQREYDRMTKLGVKFASRPKKYGPTTLVVFEDTCGNRIQLFDQPGNRPSATPGIRLKLTSVSVPNQEQALKFYTEVLGFVKKTDEPADGARWLTVVSPEEPDGAEVALEPLGFASVRTYQKALFDAGIPLTSFLVADVVKHHDRLVKLGVRFHTKPTQAGRIHIAVLDDTCGNLIQIFQR
jgi:catechol 2,3-dioxygenase-like lactoylglutathione lyase family enzyme